MLLPRSQTLRRQRLEMRWKGTGVSGSHLTEAVMLYRNGRFDEAAQRYQQLLETQPRSAEVSAGLARVYLKQKKLQQARETLSKGLMSADTAVIHVALGEILFREGKPPEAEGKKGDR